MRNIQHFHLFHRMTRNERHPFATVALGMTDDGSIKMTVAVTNNRKDNFSRKIGKAIAVGRLVSGKGVTLHTDDFGAMIDPFINRHNSMAINPKWNYSDIDSAYKTFRGIIDEVRGVRHQAVY